MKQDLIIVGAGAAGLMAARTLAAQFNITILEAAAAAGGRIHSTGSLPVEGGAEFIHGHLPQTIALLQEADIDFYEIKGRFFQVYDGEWQSDEEFIPNWDELMERMASAPLDMTLQQLLDKYFSDDVYADLRESVKMYVRGYDLADENKVSVKFLYDEWMNEDEVNYRIPRGYGALTDYLSKGHNIITGAPVKHIEWSEGRVKVITNEQTYTAHKVLVTVPVSLLQQGAITFTPAISEYKEAAQQIGWGSVTKVLFQFKTTFWKEKHGELGFIISDQTPAVWWAQAPTNRPVLTGWWAGFSEESDEVMLEKALSSLSNIFKLSIEELEGMIEHRYVFNWAKVPTALGAYSYDTPASPAAREVLNTPVADTIYFAGEALYVGDRPGTVEAGLVSGVQAAERIIASLVR
jgi:monoamine oxidase